MKDEKPTYEELENKIFQLQNEIFELKSKQNISFEKLDLEPNILNEIMNISPIGISYIDATGKVVYSNKRAGEIFQLAKTKLLEIEATLAAWRATTLDGKPFPDEELPFTRVKNTEKPVFNVEHVIEYEGEKKTISVSATPFLNNANEFMGMVAVVEDITDRKLAEEKMKESEERLSLFFAQSLDGFFFMMLDEPVEWNDSIDKEKILDYVFEHQRVTKVNSAMLDQYRTTEEQYIGLTPNDLFAHNIEHGRQVWKDSFDKGQLHIDTHEMKFDGTDMIIEGDYICLYNAHKRIIGHFGIQKEVTDIRHAEEKLRKSERKFKEMADLLPQIIFETDENGILTYVNGVSLKLFGFSEEDFNQKLNALQMIDHKDRVIAAANIQLVMNGEAPSTHEYTALRKDGTNFPVLIYSSPIVNDGRILGLRGTIIDITERKLAENALSESERRWKETLESLPQLIWSCRVDGPCDYLSSQWIEYTGIPAEKQLGYGWFEQLHPDDRERTIAEWAIKVKTGEDFNLEFRIRRYDGKYRWFKTKAIPLTDLEGNVVKWLGSNTDFDDVKKNEEILIQSEEKYRLLFTENPQPMWIYDIETLAFLEVNQAAIKHYGYSRQEFLSMTLKDIRPAEDIPTLLKNIERTSRNLSSSGEWRHIKKNGKIISVEISSHAIISNNRHARHILINDITERKRIQLEYQTMIKTSRDGFYIIDAKTGKFSDVNQSYCDMIGYSRDELLQMTIQDVEAIENLEETKQHIELIVETGFDSFETKHKTKSGRIIDIDASVTFVISDENKFFVFAKDISVRKQIESEILKLSHAIEQSPVSIIITDINGNIDYANPKVLETTGYAADEFIGKNPRLFNSGEKSKSEYEHLWATISSGREWFGEFHNKKKNGELYWEQASISPIKNAKGEITHYVAVKEDISEKKKNLEDLIEAKVRAQESDRLKSAFLANMSHEIRTPMNGVLGFARLLKEADLSGEERQEYLELMERSGNRMLNIINDIVDISKIESGLMEVHLKESNINEQIDYVYVFFKPEMDKKKIQFSCKKSLTGKEAIINTDREKMYAILTNLVKNAIKFTDEGSIEFGYNLKTVHQTNVLEFYIKDTGIGIPKDRQEDIFERFIQVDIFDKMARQGTGLGLSISKAFVELLGGKIWVSSQERIGSTFYFTLPYKTEPEEMNVVRKVVLTNSVENPVNPDVSGLKILIAEDDATSAKLISLHVNKLNKEVLIANTGNEAVEICRTNPDLDLILMDIQMPDLNGHEATRQIRQFNKDVVIIAQTAFGLSGDREKAIEAGCNDYIAKPINKDELLELIQKYFKK